MASDGFASARFADLLSEPVRNGLYKPKQFHGRGTKVVNMGELFANSRIGDLPMRRIELTEKEEAKYSLQSGDLLFARRSLVAEGAGRCSLIVEVSEPTVFESSIIRARPDQRKADSRYLHYFFSSPQGRELMMGILRQVAVAGITGSDLAELRIPLPSMKVQRGIAETLSKIDDRIDNLRQTNATLEAIAQALFKSWFVDFDPVRAKAEGREPEGMAVATAALFPNEFEDTVLGPIPSGWQVEEIGETVNCLGGATPSTKNESFWTDGPHHWATPKDLSGLRAPILTTTERRITDAGLARISSGLLPAGTLLMSSRAPIGYLAIASVPTAINQGFIAMPPGGLLPPSYLLFWARAHMGLIKQSANGSTFMEISKSAFRPIQVCVPAADVIEAFTAFVEPLLCRIELNEQKRTTLAETRDTLLPRLISGKLRLSEFEREICAAAT